MSKVQNVKKEVPSSKEMNDMDILNDIMTSEKNMSNNYSIAIDEMSNMTLFKKVFSIFKETKELGREAFDIAFKNGWYTLETAEEKKIQEAYDEASKQLKEI